MPHSLGKQYSKISLLIIVFGLLSLVRVLNEPVSITQAQNTVYDFSPVTQKMEQALLPKEQGGLGLDGAGVLLMKDGQVVYRQFFNYPQTKIVPIASATKWLTAALLMRLVDLGYLALDKPLAAYNLPNFTGLLGTITLRQLLSHTSGLEPDNACLDDRTTTLAVCVEQDIASAGFRKLIPNAPDSPRATPGSEFYYQGVGFQVVGRLAELATGRKWNDLFNQYLKTPLNMSTVSYGTGNSDNPLIGGWGRDEFGRLR